MIAPTVSYAHFLIIIVGASSRLIAYRARKTTLECYIRPKKYPGSSEPGFAACAIIHRHYKAIP